MRRDPTRDSADACAFEAMRTSLTAPGVGLADAFRRLATDDQLPAQEGRRAVNEGQTTKTKDKQAVLRAAASSRARAARRSRCRSSSRCSRAGRRPGGDAAQAVHRAQVVQHAAGQGVVPAFHRQRLRAQGQQVQRQQGGRHDAADAEAGHRQELHLGAAGRLPDRRPASPASWDRRSTRSCRS